VLETRRTLGGSRISGNAGISLLPSDAAVSVSMEEAEGECP